MKELKRDLLLLSKNLKSLTQKAEELVKKVDKVEKTKATGKPKVGAGVKTEKKAVSKKTKDVTSNETVLSIIKKAKKGINTAELMKKTGFDSIKVRNAIYKLKEQGKVKNQKRGVYIKA